MIIVWAGLMSLAAVAILNTLHLRKIPPVLFQKDQKKAGRAFAVVLDTSHVVLYAAKISASLDTAVLWI